jgi:hypothetical protein
VSDIEQPGCRPDALVAPLSIAQRPGEVDRVNALLAGAGLGRPVGAPEPVTSGLALLPVSADLLAVVRTLRALAGGSDSLAGQVDIDPLLRAATYEAGAQDRDLFPAKDIGHIPGAKKNIGHIPGAKKNIGHIATDKNIGHAKVAWVSLSTMLDRAPWQAAAGTRRPVVALLDTGVTDHWWLRVGSETDPFVVDAAQHGWRQPCPLAPPAAGDRGSHFGHGTFSAGVVRQSASQVQVLSVEVMSDTGLASEVAVVAALEWLSGADRPVDAVVLPFGRRETGVDNGLTRRHLETTLTRLDGRIRIVAAVGSDGGNRPTYPAALPNSRVIGVGSGTSAAEPDGFSDRGDRVEVWETGRDVVSVLPVTTVEGGSGVTKWSGTSFAAVRHAARLVGS